MQNMGAEELTRKTKQDNNMQPLLHTLDELPHHQINSISAELTLTRIQLCYDRLNFTRQVQTWKVRCHNRTENACNCMHL